MELIYPIIQVLLKLRYFYLSLLFPIKGLMRVVVYKTL